MKLVFLIGSQREGSLNKLLAKEIEKEFDDYDIVEYYPDDFKMFNGDLEKPEESWIKEIRENIREAEGVIIASPEYNYSVPGTVKNMIDWLSRPNEEGKYLIGGKNFALVGVTMGLDGTRLAQKELIAILHQLRANIDASNFIAVPFADVEGKFIQENKERIKNFADKFKKFIAKYIYIIMSRLCGSIFMEKLKINKILTNLQSLLKNLRPCIII